MIIPEKRPVFVELLGTPEAGKTTVIRPVASMLEQQGYKVKVLPEAAEQIPVKFPRGELLENTWIRSKTVNQVIEACMYDCDIVLVDRGIVDTCIWNEICRQRLELSETLCKEIVQLFNSLDIFPDLSVVLYVPAEIAIQRRHGEGRIVTRKFVRFFNDVVLSYLNSPKIPQKNPRLIRDTSNITPEECAEAITKYILKNLE
jgi:thymidylate kinase